MAPPLVSAPSVGRRKLLFAVVAAVILMLGAYLIVHGSGTSAAKHTRRHHARLTTATCPARSKLRHHPACAAAHPRVRRPTVQTAIRLYAASLLPVLDRS